MQYEDLDLNESAADIVQELIDQEAIANIETHDIGGATVVDCGVEVAGSLLAGRFVAEASMADLGSATIAMDRLGPWPCARVMVAVHEPAAACLLSQYAGWRIALDNYYAMASGPMRSILAKEPIFDRLNYRESEGTAVGVLETGQLPTEDVIELIAGELGVSPEDLILLAARTASIAGCYQVVARSVETCLHKLYELGYDVSLVRSAVGSAFLPPVPRKDLAAIGRTNDSILYGGEVVLWVEGDDDAIADVGPRVPSSASVDYGEPFANIFQRYGGDFYKIDPLLFSPASVVINNLSTGTCLQYGKVDWELVRRSFFG